MGCSPDPGGAYLIFRLLYLASALTFSYIMLCGCFRLNSNREDAAKIFLLAWYMFVWWHPGNGCLGGVTDRLEAEPLLLQEKRPLLP